MSESTMDLRNIVLLGHSGSGKTSFAECMLYESGAITRRGNTLSKNTISDHTLVERERGSSIFSTLMHAHWRGKKINIIDTPGYDDFAGEVICSLKVADTALLILNSTSGVEVGTEILWDYIQGFDTPSIFVINQLDHEKANYEKTLEETIARFGHKVLPVQFPIDEGSSFSKIVDALRMTMYVFPKNGGKPTKESIPAEHMPRAIEMHNSLVEAAAENEDGLMEKYFEQGSLDEEDLAKGLTIALANQEIFPVFCGSAEKNMGSGRIMGFIRDISPSPAERPGMMLKNGKRLSCSSTSPASIFIYKTLSEPQVGQVSYFKVCSGEISPGIELQNHDKSEHERLNQIFVAEGKNRKSVNKLIAGDIGVTLKLKNSLTNHTLSEKGSNIVMEPIQFPSSRIRTAVVPPSKSDMEKLMKALHQMELEDPTIKIEQSPQLKQTLLHGQGQLHLDILKYRIEKVNGIQIEFEKPRIPYRETITNSSEASYRHKKQSGGAGQFAQIEMRIEPYSEGMPDPEGLTVRKHEVEELSWGGKLSFCWCIVGGSIDAKYLNAIKKGILGQMEEGPLTGSCCQDIRVSIFDGKMHAVDSNDMAFMLAASAAFKIAFNNAQPIVLEPIYEMEILCSNQVMGDIMSDLQTRRAIIVGMEADGHLQKIVTRVPLAELYKYSATLRSISQGRAKFTREFISYEQAPNNLQSNLITDLKAIQNI